MTGGLISDHEDLISKKFSSPLDKIEIDNDSDYF